MQKCLLISLAFLLLAGIPIFSEAQSEPSTAVLARELAHKLEQLSSSTVGPNASHGTVVLTEVEINAYLEERIRESEDAGVVSLTVTLRADEAVSIEALVNFSAFDESKRGGALDLLSYLRGEVPVRFDGTFSGRNGVGTVSVETFTVSGLPLPPPVFRELVKSYTSNEGMPEGIDVLRAFELPYGIAELKVEHGRIDIVQ